MDTTTQTPRDDDVTENNDSRDIDDHHDTTEYTEKHKEDIEGGESTKDSGIHQDEDGYDESYADEEFEEDEPQSDDEKSMDIFVRALRLYCWLHLVQAEQFELVLLFVNPSRLLSKTKYDLSASLKAGT